jgi:hypothetical protein
MEIPGMAIISMKDMANIAMTVIQAMGMIMPTLIPVTKLQYYDLQKIIYKSAK